MKRILYYTIFVLCAAACGQRVSQEESASTEYETMTVSRSDISLEETYPASIEGRQSIRIIPRVEGYLQDIKVKEGQRVRKGQVLFVLDQASYVADEKAARANVEVAKAKWEAARSNLSYTVLKSPSDGVVGSLPYRKGDYVGPTIQDGLTTIADNGEMYVYFSLTERDIMRRMEESGSMEKLSASFPPVSLQTAGGETYPLQGRLESISGVVDRSTGALSARAVFPNPDGRLLSGSTGRLLIPQAMLPQEVLKMGVAVEKQGAASATVGQHNIVERYRLLTRKKVRIEDAPDYYRVTLLLLPAR